MDNTTETDRQEHLDWAKKRAIEYADRGELQNALQSLISDLDKHPQTRNHAGFMLLPAYYLETDPSKIRYYIEGFN